MKSEFQQTTSSAGLIGLTAFGGAVIGFFLQLLVAYYFGASEETDAYFMALSTSELLSKLLLGGSITAVFLPMFVAKLTRHDRQSAWQLALNVTHLSASVFAVAVVLIGVFADPFVGFIAPGFDSATTNLTVSLLRTLLPAFVFFFLVELATSMLHALKQFAIPSTVRLISPIVSLVSVALLAPSLGIFSLALGTVIGSLLQLTWLIFGLRRQGLRYHLIFQPTHPDIKRIIALVYPFIFSVLATQGAGITYRILVSNLTPGSLAALKFAEKITQLVTIIFLNSITMVIFPLLSEKAARQDYLGIKQTIASSIRLVVFTTTPIIVGIMLLTRPFVSFVYQRGSFSEHDVTLTSLALFYLVIGLIFNGISSILGHATLALQETKAAVAVTIVSHAVAIYLFVLLVPRLSHAGLALGSSLVPLVIALLYFLYLTRFIPNLKTVFWHPTYLKIAALALILAAAISFVNSLTPGFILQSLIGTAIFFGGAYFWRIPEMRALAAIIRGKIMKWQTP